MPSTSATIVRLLEMREGAERRRPTRYGGIMKGSRAPHEEAYILRDYQDGSEYRLKW